MHHLYPSSKGDQICPLGFHPQTRWPTRCKRCFRDYKEHGGKRGGDDIASSSPNLSDGLNSKPSTKSWTSTQNLSTSTNGSANNNDVELKKRPQSWTSTPVLDEQKDHTKGNSRADSIVIHPVENNVDVTLSLQLHPRRHTTTLCLKELDESNTKQRLSSSSSSSTASSPSKDIPNDLVIQYNDSLAERMRKMTLLKKQRSANSRDSSRERSIPKRSEDDNNSSSETERGPPPDRPDRNKNMSHADLKRLSLSPKKTSSSTSTSTSTSIAKLPAPSVVTTGVSVTSSIDTKSLESSSSSYTSTKSTNLARRKEADKIKATQDVAFMLKIKDKNYSEKRQSDNISLTTETTDATLVGPNDGELHDEVKSLRGELENMRNRAERAEREKSDILLRRLASMDTAPNRTAASEALMLQQKVNDLTAQLEQVNDEKRRLNVRMKVLESNPKNVEYELKRKLQAAEQLCEELMEENQRTTKELHGLKDEMDEMHDSFRDNQAEVNTTLQKQLESTTKNCRILSFKLKKCERKIETLELEKQTSCNDDLVVKLKKMEEELKFSNELARKLQADAEELRSPGKKRPPMLGVIGKSTSADGKFTRESLTRGGSQEDQQQLMRDLQDSIERESDLKDQLKFSEEEAEHLRNKVIRFEDENESLMMQLKKMASRSRSQKLSTTTSRLTPEAPSDHDEGISDEDDPAELRVLLELNEQEASILRIKVEDLEKENKESRKQVKELQEKLKNDVNGSKRLPSLLSFNSSNTAEKKLKALNDDITLLRKTIIERDREIERLQADIVVFKTNKNDKTRLKQDANVDFKQQLNLVEQEATILRSKITAIECENEKLLKDNKRLQLQALKTNCLGMGNGSLGELIKLKESLTIVERERNNVSSKLKRILQEAEEKLPQRKPKVVTDLTPKNHLKKWVEELEEEIAEMRAIVLNCNGDKIKKLDTEKTAIEQNLQIVKDQLSTAEKDLKKLKVTSGVTLDQKLRKSDDDNKKLNSKIKDLEEKIKKQDNQIKHTEAAKSLLECQLKRDKDKLNSLEKEYEKERKEREKWEAKVSQIDDELYATRKSADKTKTALEKEIKDLKSKPGNSKHDSASVKQVQELKKQLEDLQSSLSEEQTRYSDLNTHWEKLSEETILMRALLTTEKQNLQSELNATKQKLVDIDSLQTEKSEIAKQLKDAQKRIQNLESKQKNGGSMEYEKAMLKNKIAEKDQEYDRLRRENDMNIDLVFQLRKDNDEISRKLNDFSRIEQAQSSINGQNARLENEIKSLKIKLENAELNSKSEVASTRLRYEQQVKNLSTEITSMQRQCERFKKDRDSFKQLLESAQKKIGDLKANNTGRQSRGSMHSSDDDDKSKIAYLEQQIGCLEDQLCESRLEVSKVKTDLVSERSANEIKISEMQSKLNEFEEDRVIGSGRTKIPGMKTKLELSWQKEREDQQRLLQETSTLARDLRQTLFEVERERDKERLDSKRRLDQLKRSTEEEMEEGRKKIAELQCDLLELRDVHAKLRTSNEKLRRERERYEKELIKRRMEHDGGERKVGALLQTVDELVKIAPDLKMATSDSVGKSTSIGGSNSLRPEQSNTRRSRSPSPTLSSSQITNVLARLAEASEELRKFQRNSEDENERTRIRRSNLRRAASQENDTAVTTASVLGATSNIRTGNGSKLSRSSIHNGSLIRKSLSLDHSIQQDQNIWRQDDGSVSSIQSIDSELGGLVRDSSFDSHLDSRLSGGSTQSDMPRGPRKKKKSLMGKLRSLAKSSRNSESEISIQGSDSDISVASDMRASKKDLRGRLSGMFKRSGSASRSVSTERTMTATTQQRPVAVTVVGDDDGPKAHDPPSGSATTPKPIRSIAKPPTPTPLTPQTKRRLAK